MRQSTFLADHMHWVWLAFCNAKNEPFAVTQVVTFFDKNEDQCGKRCGSKIVPRDTWSSESAEYANCAEDASRTSGGAVKPFAHMIQVAHGFSERKLYNWLRLLRPAVVHHQGALRTEVERAAHTLRLPIIAGFHFWHGMLQINEKHGNIRMLAHADKHTMDKNYRHTKRRSDTIYVPSEYFRKVIGSVGGAAEADRLVVVPPISDEKEIMFQRTRSSGGSGGSAAARRRQTMFVGDSVRKFPLGFVTMINIHESKGGRLFLYMLEHLDASIPLLGVRTDVFRTEVDVAIDRAVACRGRKNAFIVGRQSDVSLVYGRTALLLQASECDETFCRVALEAHANGVPTLVSDYGNVPYLLATAEARDRTLIRSAGLHEDGTPQYYRKWCDAIESEWRLLLQQRKAARRRIGDASEPKPLGRVCRENYEAVCAQNNVAMLFNSALRRTVAGGRQRRWRNVALFAPWCDQGLGIQTRNYARLLLKHNFRVFVFAFQPYTGKREQANEDEWRLPGVSVYYSPHHREAVTSHELACFAVKTQIGHAIIAETCWNRVFSMMRELRAMDVRTYAVPNVEIVRKDEIEKHHVFDAVLINNAACRVLFERHGFPRDLLHHVGYAAEVREEVLREIAKRNAQSKPLVDSSGRRVLRFLIVGGRNAIFRKHVDIVLDAFLSVFRNGDPVQFIGTSQLDCDEFAPFKARLAQRGCPAQLLIGNLSAERIGQLYSECDLVFQVSKHEGLGIGFFEALLYEKPICTLNVDPHRECAPADVAWHLEPDALEENVENNSCGVLSARVSKDTFVPFFESIRAGLCARDAATVDAWWRDEYCRRQQRIAAHNQTILQNFEDRFINVLSQFS